jgi:chemotaxis methyl-accepting protein methylase/HPt (histidine-containing phosphotransfer) domain-containing protein
MMEEVLQQLDELSVKMVVGGTDAPETLRLLAAIERSAREAGRIPAADAAMELKARATGAARTSSGEFEKVVTKGIDSLRRALESAAPQASTTNSIAQDPELIGDFVNEATEHLATIEAQILVLERDPTAADPLNAAFRGFHTIKGLAGFLDLGDIREVAHEVETLLDRARNQELLLTPAIVDVVLESADYLKRAIVWVQAGLNGKAGDAPPFDKLLGRVRAVLEGKHIAVAAPLETARSVEKSAPEAEAASSLRVDAGKLDYMMDMVGELVIAQSLIAHNPEIAALESGVLQRNLQQLGRITAEVQRVAMSMRMTPVSTLFGRMNRLVRDLTRKNGKKVRLDLSGEDTELDKTIIEQLADPMMHMVRNSLDHGLEGPEERAADGKSPEGKLVLSASHQAGHIGPREFEKFRRLAYDKFGLNLTEGKHELVAARLGKKLRELKVPSYEAYYDLVVADRSGESLIALIDALSTNHTSFLREASHFTFLVSTVLPALQKRVTIDIWSAPCSTGEEPYSIAVMLLEKLGMPPKPALRIRATDISTRALAIAKKGVYAADRLGAMPLPLIRKYFNEAGPGTFQIKPEIGRMVEFERVNLVEPLRAGRSFPVIFCRNLMIYWDKPTQERVVANLSQLLEPGGYLMIGHSESLMGVKHSLEYVQPAIYRKPGVSA